MAEAIRVVDGTSLHHNPITMTTLSTSSSAAAAPRLLKELDDAHAVIRHLREQCAAWQMKCMTLEAELRSARRSTDVLRKVHLASVAAFSDEVVAAALLHEEAICRAAIVTEAAQYCVKRALPPQPAKEVQRLESAFDTPTFVRAGLSSAAQISQHCSRLRGVVARAVASLSRSAFEEEPHPAKDGHTDDPPTAAEGHPKAATPEASKGGAVVVIRIDAATQTAPAPVRQKRDIPAPSGDAAATVDVADHYSPQPSAPSQQSAPIVVHDDDEAVMLKKQIALMQSEISSLLRLNERRENVAAVTGRPSPTTLAVNASVVAPTASRPRGALRSAPLYPTSSTYRAQVHPSVIPGADTAVDPLNNPVATLARNRVSLAVSRRSLSPESRVLLSGPL